VLPPSPFPGAAQIQEKKGDFQLHIGETRKENSLMTPPLFSFSHYTGVTQIYRKES